MPRSIHGMHAGGRSWSTLRLNNQEVGLPGSCRVYLENLPSKTLEYTSLVMISKTREDSCRHYTLKDKQAKHMVASMKNTHIHSHEYLTYLRSKTRACVRILHFPSIPHKISLNPIVVIIIHPCATPIPFPYRTLLICSFASVSQHQCRCSRL